MNQVAGRSARKPDIRAVISDFGGVLTTPLREAFTAYEERSGIAVADLGRAMAEAAERHGEHPLYALERGELSEWEFLRRLEVGLQNGARLDGLRDAYFEQLSPNRVMIDFMRGLRGRGLRMALLTNNVREWEPLWRAKLPEVEEIFEVVVDSAFVGMRKPEPEIYELTVARLRTVAPTECLFLDDLDVNCEAARLVGMHAVQFHTNEQAIAEVEALLSA